MPASAANTVSTVSTASDRYKAGMTVRRAPLGRLWLCMAWLASSCAGTAVAQTAAPGPERQQQLVHLVRQDCGSCHGMTLKGGLGSPLLAENMRDKPADSLVATILQGRPGTAMPPWLGIIDEADAVWIVEQLQRGFPLE